MTNSRCLVGLRPVAVVLLLGAGGFPCALPAQVAAQPLAAQVRRVVEAMDFLGSPLPPATVAALDAVAAMRDEDAAVAAIEAALDPHCLVVVAINPESRVKVARGQAPAQLVEHGWRQFLVKVVNQAGVTASLAAVSPNALSLFESGTKTASDRALRPDDGAPAAAGRDDAAAWGRERWLDLRPFTAQPMQKTLSGLGLEYCILGLYSKDAGQREAKLAFDVGQGTQDLGFRSTVDILFDCAPAHALTLRVLDVDGKPTTAAFVIRDEQGRVYPALAKRLAPDFAFQPQVYRADGETVRLPAGRGGEGDAWRGSVSARRWCGKRQLSCIGCRTRALRGLAVTLRR